ncbi:MAG: ferric reductase-like transmembrane domain-containing protein [Candidatus Altiarchaeota archaeon]
MEAKALVLGVGGTAALFVFLLFSLFVRDTAIIWYETRAFGIGAYLLLFLAVGSGEWRILTKGKSQFPLFRFHKPVAVAAVVTTFAHFIAGVLDNYKWGPHLNITQYLGFSFSDKWLVFLSLGTLAFYLMAAVAATSGPRTIRFIGFPRWKLTHLLGYVAYYMGYAHAVNLGTDMKASSLSWMFSPLMVLSLCTISGLLMARALNGAFNILSDQAEVWMAAALFVLMFLVFILFASHALGIWERLDTLLPPQELFI